LSKPSRCRSARSWRSTAVPMFSGRLWSSAFHAIPAGKSLGAKPCRGSATKSPRTSRCPVARCCQLTTSSGCRRSSGVSALRVARSGCCTNHREIAGAYACNPEWTKAVERFRPLLTVSGHDHETPKRYNAWHGQLGDAVCVNVGRGVMTLHFCVLDFEFPQSQPCLPTRITLEALPWKSQVVIHPR